MFFGIEWMAYRKLYAQALVFLLLSGCLWGLAALLYDPLGMLVNSGLHFLLGACGNALYRQKALRLLRHTDGAQRLAVLTRRGGVNTAAVALLLLLNLAYELWVILL